MQIIFLIIVIGLLVASFKFIWKHLPLILTLGTIGAALYFYTKITIYFFILIFISSIIFATIREYKIKSKFIPSLKDENYDTFFENYEDCSTKDKKIVINLIKNNFDNSTHILKKVFYFDFFSFSSKDYQDDNKIIFEKEECINFLEKIWKDDTVALLDELIKKSGSLIEEIEFTGEKKVKTKLIKIHSTNDVEDLLDKDDFSDAISLDDL